MALDRDAARRALEKIGGVFGLTAEAMAQGVVDVVNAKMADAIRTITVRRGIDPRDFSLVAFGGAGPAQAGALAEELEIHEVIVPVHPGAFSAWGMLQTDVRHDYKETLYSFWDLLDLAVLESAFAGLEENGRRQLLDEGVAPDAIAFERAIDLRYYGQEYVLTIPVPHGPIDMDAVRRSFDAAYDRQYGHSSPENRVEMANVRVAALGQLPRPGSAPPAREPARPARERDVFFAGLPRKTPILDRNGLAIGNPGERTRDHRGIDRDDSRAPRLAGHGDRGGAPLHDERGCAADQRDMTKATHPRSKPGRSAQGEMQAFLFVAASCVSLMEPLCNIHSSPRLGTPQGI